jgi:hypothetical protein
MGNAGVVFIVILFVVVAVVIRLMAGGLDQDRVRSYVESRGGRFLDSSWAPFGKGWFGEKNDRIYEVRFLDGQGNEHHASCKTSLFSGVYFTDDRIVRHAKAGTDEQADHDSGIVAEGDLQRIALEEENRRLREEVERLKRAEA